MASLELLRLIRIHAQLEGVSEAAGGLKGLTAAHEQLGRVTEATTRVTETQTRMTLSQADSFERTKRRVDEAYRTQQDYLRIQRQLKEEVDAGRRSHEEMNRVLQQMRDRYNEVARAAGGVDPNRMLAQPLSGGSARSSCALFEEMDRKIGAAHVAAVREIEAADADAARQIAEMARQAEALRAAIDPATAALNSQSAEVARYRALLEAGVISSTEFTAAQQLAADRYQNTIRTLDGGSQALRMTQQDTINLGYQFNDLAVQLASGQSPFVAIVQQGMQVTQILGQEGSIREGLAALRTGFMGMLTPVNMAVVGIAALAAGAAYLWSINRAEAPKANDLLSKHLDLLEEMSVRYKGLGEAASDAADQSVEAAEAMARATESQIRKLIEAQSKAVAHEALGSTRGVTEFNNMIGIGNLFPEGWTAESWRLGPALETMRRFNEEVKRGQPDVIRMRREVAQILLDPQLDRGLRQTLNLVMQNSAEAEQLQRRLRAVKPPMMDPQSGIIQHGQAVLDAEEAINTINEALPENEAIKRFNEQMEELSNSIAKLRANAVQLRPGDLIAIGPEEVDAQQAANKALEDGAIATERLANAKSTLLSETERLVRQAAIERARLEAPSPERDARIAAMEAELDLAGELRTTEERRIAITLAGEQARAAAIHANNEAVTSHLRGMQAQLEASALERDSIGLTIRETERLRFEQEAMQQAQDQAFQSGIAVSPEYQAAIRAAAEAWGELQEKIALARLEQDLTMERARIGMTDGEAAIHSRLTGAGINPASAQGEMLAQQMRINQSLELGKDLATDFAGGLASDLMDGVSAMEALSNALDRFADRLMQLAVDQAVSALFSGLTGGFGLGSDMGAAVWHEGGLIGANDNKPTRYVDPRLFIGAPRYHRGGIVGLAPDERPIIAQVGEEVIPKGRRSTGGEVLVRLHLSDDLRAEVDSRSTRNARVEVTRATPGILRQVAEAKRRSPR